MSDFTIGKLARESGCKVQTIRYYEQIGLLPEPYRSEGNQRLYDRVDVDRLSFIRHARALGFSLTEVRELMTLSDDPDRPCESVDLIARSNLTKVEDKIAQLTALREELKRMVHECEGGQISDCRVINILSDHGQCLTDKHE